MSRYAWFAAAVCLVGASPPGGAGDDLKKLEGTWALVSGEQEGRPLPPETLKTASLLIKGDHHTVKVGQDLFVGTHKLDPARMPKQIDAMDTEGVFKGKTSLGIYKLTAEEFTVCFAPPGKDRPKEFTTKSGAATMLHVWRRSKP
jgi:uncharacterized protein (TIGR03067 family)